MTHVPLLQTGRTDGLLAQPAPWVLQLAHSRLPRSPAHRLTVAIWSMAMASIHVVSQLEPMAVIVQSASTVQARAASQRVVTSLRHWARPSRHSCEGAWQVPQQALSEVNISCPAGQPCGQVSGWHTTGGGVGTASFGPLATHTGQHPDVAKAVCS